MWDQYFSPIEIIPPVDIVQPLCAAALQKRVVLKKFAELGGRQQTRHTLPKDLESATLCRGFPKFMKTRIRARFQVMVLAFATLAYNPIPANADKLFSDVALDHPYFVAISELERRGILNGYDDGSFRPEADISRAEALKVVLLTAGAEVSGIVNSRPFPDVPIDSWFAGITWKGVELGIVKGDGEGFFQPTRNVTRSEALAMLFRVEGAEPPEVDSPPFLDVPEYAWYAGYFAEAKNRGLIAGENVAPDHLLTRGQLSDLTYRFFEEEWDDTELVGSASYYGSGFDGRRTASGSILDNGKFHAAHRTLPFGTRVRVVQEEFLNSVVVEIVDRGPYVQGRVIDLTQAAFDALVPLSRGVTPVRLEIVPDMTPLGIAVDCEPVDSKTIAADAFADILLTAPMPSMFRSGEVYSVQGTVLSNPPTDEVTAYYRKDGKTSYFFAPVEASAFSLPVFFQQAGDFEFSILPGRSGTARVENITVQADTCEPNLEITTTDPKNFRHFLQEGNAVLQWDDNENDIFRIEISQDTNSVTYFVRDTNQFAPPLAPLQGFKEGLMSISIWGAQSDGGPLQRTSGWAFGSEKKVYAVEHVSREDNEISDIELTSDFTPGSNIVIRGRTEKALSDQAVIIQPDETIIEVPLAINGSDFHATFAPTQNGPHIFEINQDDALMLFVGASIPSGMAPLIPSYFDLRNQDDQEPVALELMPNVMLGLVNQERAERGLVEVSLNENLGKLAQFRADDMCANQYLAHVDGDGNTAEDYRVLYDVQTAVAENLAKDRNARGAHAGLMRSPQHRKAIINPNHTRVGFGLCFSEESDPPPLIAVQIFGGEAFSSDNIPAYREQILSEVNAIRVDDPVLPNTVLESVAQDWANTMADNDFWGFSYGDESLEQNLRSAGIKRAAKSIVFKLGSITEIKNAFREADITIGESTQANFLLDLDYEKLGVGVAQSDTWDVFLVVLGTR